MPPRLLGFLLRLCRVALIVGGVCSFRLLTARFHVNSLKLYSCVTCSQKDPICVLLMIYPETIAKHCNISRHIRNLPWRAKRVAIIPILKVGIHFLFFLPLPFHSTDQICSEKAKSSSFMITSWPRPSRCHAYSITKEMVFKPASRLVPILCSDLSQYRHSWIMQT